jgi:hypothetical protein
MASFKRLKRSDVISVPYVANKNWVFEYCPYPENDQNLVIFKGTLIITIPCVPNPPFPSPPLP